MITFYLCLAGAMILIMAAGYGAYRLTIGGWPERPLARLHYAITRYRLPHLRGAPGLELSDYTNVYRALVDFTRQRDAQEGNRS